MSYTYIGWFQHINPFALAVLWIIGFFLYFLPSFLAVYLRRRDQIIIIMLNVLFGWTAVGWLVLLLWSLSVFNRIRA